MKNKGQCCAEELGLRSEVAVDEWLAMWEWTEKVRRQQSDNGVDHSLRG